MVRNRQKATINSLIEAHIEPGSTILHDGWKGYAKIPTGYQSIRVMHQDQNSENHTSYIEGLWSELRAFVQSSYSGGLVERNVDRIIMEGIWRRDIRRRNLALMQQVNELADIIRNY